MRWSEVRQAFENLHVHGERSSAPKVRASARTIAAEESFAPRCRGPCVFVCAGLFSPDSNGRRVVVFPRDCRFSLMRVRKCKGSPDRPLGESPTNCVSQKPP